MAAPAPLVPLAFDPFPVVRIKGELTAAGARVTLLSVQAPRDVRIDVDCIGKDCPAKHFRSPAGKHRLSKFERSWRAGTRLSVRVTKPGYIGKFTEFVIRRQAEPKRSDRCLTPGATRPVPCAVSSLALRALLVLGFVASFAVASRPDAASPSDAETARGRRAARREAAARGRPAARGGRSGDRRAGGHARGEAAREGEAAPARPGRAARQAAPGEDVAERRPGAADGDRAGGGDAGSGARADGTRRVGAGPVQAREPAAPGQAQAALRFLRRLRLGGMTMLWRGLGAFAAIAALGAIAGHVATAGGEPATTHEVRVGAATLTVAGQWRQLDAATLTDGRDRLHVALARASPKGAGQPARLGGYEALAYGDATVLPTTRGALVVECRRCAGAVRSVVVPGAAILAPAPDLALRLKAPAVLATLDATRVKERTAWTPASAARLAAAHRAALDALGPLATPALTRALNDAAGAYDTLARTPSASQTALTAADGELEDAVAALARTGAPRVQRAADLPGDGGVSLVTLALILLSAVLISALAPAVFRRARTARTAGRTPATKACLLTQRRTPIAPPPTYGRWNEAPRGPGAVPQDGAQSATASSSTA